MDDPSTDPINNFFSTEELQQPYALYSALSLLSADTSGATSSAVQQISQDEVKKAYRRAALRFHPDKHVHKNDDQKQQVSREFQKVGFAYAVLGDEARKKRYDETGRTDESFFAGGGPGEGGWEAYFEAVFKRVDKKMLDEDKAEYQGSEEEKKDLHEAFTSSKGSLPSILDGIPHSTTDDESRFIEIINAAIASGQLSKTSEWIKSTVKDYERGRKKRVAKEKKEAVEAEKAAKELGVWEEFYGNGSKAHGSQKKGAKKTENHEDDEELAAETSSGGQMAQKRKRKPRAANDAEPREDTSALEALISARQKSRSGAMDALFAKYSAASKDDDEEIDMKAGKKRQRKTRKGVDGAGTEDEQEAPPALDDADFEAFQKKLFTEKQSGTKPPPVGKKVRKRR